MKGLELHSVRRLGASSAACRPERGDWSLNHNNRHCVGICKVVSIIGSRSVLRRLARSIMDIIRSCTLQHPLRDLTRKCDLLVSHLLLHPVPPLLPLLVVQRHLLPLIPHNLQPNLVPIVLSSAPPRFTHQAHQRLLLRPSLFLRHVWQIGRPVTSAVVCKGQTQSVRADFPCQGIVVQRGLEVCEQRDGAL